MKIGQEILIVKYKSILRKKSLVIDKDIIKLFYYFLKYVRMIIVGGVLID